MKTATCKCGKPIYCYPYSRLWLHDRDQIPCDPAHFAGDGPWWAADGTGPMVIDLYTGPKAAPA